MANIVRLDKVKSVYNGNLESMVHTVDLDNGSFVQVGALKTGEREIKEVKVPTASSILDEPMVIVASDEVIKDAKTSYNLGDFTNKKDETLKAYHLEVGDIVTVTVGQVKGTVAVGKYVIPQATKTALAIADDRTGGTRFVGKVLETDKLKYPETDAVVIQVVAN